MGRLLGACRARLRRASIRLARAVRPRPRRRGTLFIGYAEAALGLGESQRGLIAAAAARRLPFAIHPLSLGVETRIVGPYLPGCYDRTHRYDVNIVEISGDQIAAVLGALDPRLFASSYNVLRTYWELPKAPPAWAGALSRFDEIWAPNAFVAGAFRDIFAGPVTIVPPCVVIDDAAAYPGRAAFGLAESRFHFLFAFDAHSFPTRKNPLGVVAAFRAAFPAAFPGRDDGVGLVVKSTEASRDPAVAGEIAAAAAADSRIRPLDRTLTRAEMLGLIAACDCYVSLHRSEGFGFGMAEAMHFGKPVVATDFSGSSDFLSAATGFPVPYRLRPVRPDEYIHTDGQFWAEPDLAAAADLLRTVYRDAGLRAARAAAGKAFVDAHYGIAAVGAVAEARIREIMARRKPGG